MKDNTARLSGTELGVALAFKILLGIVYGYIYLHFYGGDDTWHDHQYSLKETQLLLTDPRSFFTNEYTPAHALAEGDGWRQVLHLYFVDLQYAMFIKTFAILNLITGGNYYINMALFNVIVLSAHYWLYKTIVVQFPEKRKLIYYSCFFYAPAVFWLSGLRIDGVLFFFVTLFIYSLVLKKQQWFLLPLAYLGMFLSRPEVALLMLPAAAGYWWSVKKGKSFWRFTATYGIFVLVFVSSSWLLPGGGAPAAVAGIQHKFLSLAGTRFSLDTLTGHPLTYLRVLPQAVANTFLRPFPWEAQGALQLMAAAEIILFWLIVLAVLLFFRPSALSRRIQEPLLLLFIFFAVSIYISIGFIVPFPGAIIRYKAVALLLLVQTAVILYKKQTN